MKKFTFLMEFRGGTYISQIDEKSLVEAQKMWAKELFKQEIKYLGKQSKSEILDNIISISPTEINGLKNVWCFSIALVTGIAIVNVILTID